MKAVEKSGRSVEEAVALAVEELGIELGQAVVEVLEEPRGGLFGILGSRPAVVRVHAKETPTQRVYSFLAGVCGAAALDAKVILEDEEDPLRFAVRGGQSRLLIGHRGQTQEALQMLANIACRRGADEGIVPRVLVDVEGYRRRREETLERLAERSAEKAVRSRQPVPLEPMSAQDRRIIHMALAEHPGVSTVSEEEEPFRRVVIIPKGG